MNKIDYFSAAFSAQHLSQVYDWWGKKAYRFVKDTLTLNLIYTFSNYSADIQHPLQQGLIAVNPLPIYSTIIPQALSFLCFCCCLLCI